MIKLNNRSTISIIVVTYNAVADLEATLKSIVKNRNLLGEFIIIDGGSTDGTLDIIRRYQSFLTYCKSEPDRGIYDAMNKGWKQADENNHILFLGAGDIIISLPNFADLKADIVYFGGIIIGDSRVFDAKVDFRLRIGNTVHHQALLIPKRLHVQPPFNVKYKVYADFDFNQRLLKSKVKFVKNDQLKSYVLPNGFSQHFKTVEWYHIIKKNFGSPYAYLGYLYHKFQLIRKKTPNL